MSELKRFRPGLARFQFIPFDFDQASLVLLSNLKHQRKVAANLPLYSEWKDPPARRIAFSDPVADQPVGQLRAINR